MGGTLVADFCKVNLFFALTNWIIRFSHKLIEARRTDRRRRATIFETDLSEVIASGLIASFARADSELMSDVGRDKLGQEHTAPSASDPREPRISTFRRRRTQTLAESPQIVRNSKPGNKLNVLVPKLPRNPHA
jgi:hypothetical protein